MWPTQFAIPSSGHRVCRAVRPVQVDEGVLVVEELGPMGFIKGHFPTHHFGLDFTSDGRSDVVPSDQSAATPALWFTAER